MCYSIQILVLVLIGDKISNCLCSTLATINDKQEIPIASESENIEIVHGTLGINDFIVPNEKILPPPSFVPFHNPYLMFHYPEPIWRASANLTSNLPEDKDKIQGIITFQQWNPNNYARITINATGIPKGKHAVHIHYFGDVSDGCNSTGPHFQSNFIGNIEAKDNEEVSASFFSAFLNIFGYHGIIGRSVVIHEKPIETQTFSPDVFSSPLMPDNVSFQTEENLVGPAIACGVITITENKKN